MAPRIELPAIKALPPFASLGYRRRDTWPNRGLVLFRVGLRLDLRLWAESGL